jgi:acetyltransferase EpsM
LHQDWLLDASNTIDLLTLSRINSTTAVDLEQWDDGHQCPAHLSKGRRSDLAYSRRGLRVTWNLPGDLQSTVAQFAIFQGLYEPLMLRHSADPFFHFPSAYYQKLTDLGKEIGIAIAWLENQPVGAAAFMAGHTRSHYHLSATNDLGRKYKAATLLVVAGAGWAREKCCKVLHLGGGMRPDDTLQLFKQSFGGKQYKYGSLMLIPDHARYQAMGELDSPRWPYLKKMEHPVEEREYQCNLGDDSISSFIARDTGTSGVSVSIRSRDSAEAVKANAETDQRAVPTARDLIIIGGGEHARVLAEAALSRPDLWRLEGFIDSEPCDSFAHILQIAYLGGDHSLITRSTREGGCWVVVGVGGVRASDHRAKIVGSLQGLGMLKWAKVVHSAAWVSPTATIEEGAVVMAGALVNSGALIGPHSVVNTGAIIEHDVRVGAFAMVSPGATIGGGTVLGANSFIGLGASIRDHVTIGAGAMVGMGSVVVKDVPAGQVVAGVPARIVPPKMPLVLKRLNSGFK